MGPDEPRSLAREWQAAGELAQLVADPVYYGYGVPRGDGRLVLVLPGLFGGDLYLEPLRTWLGRIGYRTMASSLTFNAGCPERRSRTVEAALRRRLERESRPVALIGHSRGGIIARALAARLQDQISHLILLGSPVGALTLLTPREPGAPPTPLPGSPVVAEASLLVRRLLDPHCTFPDCECPFPEDLRRPLSPHTRIATVYTSDDPVVAAAACAVPDARTTVVSGTHSGLVYNRAVYRELAAILAEQT